MDKPFPALLRYDPYVGIIQIRFRVEVFNFLSACLQAPRFSVYSFKVVKL